MRLASFVPTIARPSLPVAAADTVKRLPAPAVLPATPTRGHDGPPKPGFSIEEFVRIARIAGAL